MGKPQEEFVGDILGKEKRAFQLRADVANFEEKLMGAIGKAMAWYLDRAMLSTGSAGDAAGKVQSVLQSPAKIEVSAETGQAASTIVHENVLKMIARLWPPSFQRSVWLSNPNCLPQLMTLSLAIGTGGSRVPVLNERNGQFSVYGRPLLLSEKMPALGSAGCLALLDLSQYAVGMRASLAIALSQHIKCQEDQLAIRAIMRVDSMGTWDEALTPMAGDTLSPFITLGAVA